MDVFQIMLPPSLEKIPRPVDMVDVYRKSALQCPCLGCPHRAICRDDDIECADYLAYK